MYAILGRKKMCCLQRNKHVGLPPCAFCSRSLSSAEVTSFFVRLVSKGSIQQQFCFVLFLFHQGKPELSSLLLLFSFQLICSSRCCRQFSFTVTYPVLMVWHEDLLVLWAYPDVCKLQLVARTILAYSGRRERKGILRESAFLCTWTRLCHLKFSDWEFSLFQVSVSRHASGKKDMFCKV